MHFPLNVCRFLLSAPPRLLALCETYNGGGEVESGKWKGESGKGKAESGKRKVIDVPRKTYMLIYPDP
jgi:hypothetical protein